jgi:hypothetical protein
MQRALEQERAHRAAFEPDTPAAQRCERRDLGAAEQHVGAVRLVAHGHGDQVEAAAARVQHLVERQAGGLDGAGLQRREAVGCRRHLDQTHDTGIEPPGDALGLGEQVRCPVDAGHPQRRRTVAPAAGQRRHHRQRRAGAQPAAAAQHDGIARRRCHRSGPSVRVRGPAHQPSRCTRRSAALRSRTAPRPLRLAT